MPDFQRYETEWERLRLVVESRPEYWQLFVYDTENCEVLHTAQRISPDIAKIAAVEFAAAYRFGPQHDLEPEIISEMLIWDAS
jgi:hypothetical protein